MAVLRAHHNVDDWIHAGCQVDEDIAGDVEAGNFHNMAECFGDGDGQIADEKAEEYHQDHLEQFLVFGRHLAGLRDPRPARRPRGAAPAAEHARHALLLPWFAWFLRRAAASAQLVRRADDDGRLQVVFLWGFFLSRGGEDGGCGV